MVMKRKSRRRGARGKEEDKTKCCEGGEESGEGKGQTGVELRRRKNVGKEKQSMRAKRKRK